MRPEAPQTFQHFPQQAVELGDLGRAEIDPLLLDPLPDDRQHGQDQFPSWRRQRQFHPAAVLRTRFTADPARTDQVIRQTGHIGTGCNQGVAQMAGIQPVVLAAQNHGERQEGRTVEPKLWKVLVINIVQFLENIKEQTVQHNPVPGHARQLPGYAADAILEIGEVQVHVFAMLASRLVSILASEIVSNVTIFII